MTEQEIAAAVDKLEEKKCLGFIAEFKLEVLERHGKVFVVAPKPNFQCSRWYSYTVVSKDHPELDEIVAGKKCPHKNDGRESVLPDHFRNYLDALFQFSFLDLSGLDDSPEADELRDKMEEPWYAMTKQEREVVERIGEHINKVSFALEAVHGDKWPLL